MQCDGGFCASNLVIQAAWNGYLSESIAYDGLGMWEVGEGGLFPRMTVKFQVLMFTAL